MTQPIPCFSGFTLSVHRQEAATVAQVQPPRKPGLAIIVLHVFEHPTTTYLHAVGRQISTVKTMLWLLRAAVLVLCSAGLDAAADLQVQVQHPAAPARGEPGKSRPLKGRFLHITG